MVRRRTAALCVLAMVGLGACGGGDSAPSESEFEFGTEGGTLKPEDVRAAPAEVGEGFTELASFVAEIAAATGSDVERAAAAQEKILPVWESILGTVKANDEAAFQSLDDGFNALAEAISLGDRTLAATVAAQFTSVSAAYLARFPATGSPSAPPVSPASTPSASPAPTAGPSATRSPTSAPGPATEY